MRTIAAREGTPTVTTSLHSPATEPTRRKMTDTRYGEPFEIVPKADGVPRSAWFRTRRRSTWHRAYASALIVLDYLAVVLADLTATTQLDQAPSGFQNNVGLFHAMVYVILPVAWLI